MAIQTDPAINHAPNPPLQLTAAREIVRFLTAFLGALAAAECRPLGGTMLCTTKKRIIQRLRP
jgi:hypothetical protein